MPKDFLTKNFGKPVQDTTPAAKAAAAADAKAPANEPKVETSKPSINGPK